MRHYKKIENDYVYCIGTGPGGEEITQAEFENILSIIRTRPMPEPGYDYRLRTDLTWELVELPPEPEDPEISDEDALAIIIGGDNA